MEHKVYITHCEEDEKTAGKIYTALEKAEIKCWMTSRDMQEEQDKPEAVAEAIANSEVVVLIFSENANRSKEIANELILTMDSGSIVIPFKIDDAAPQGALQYYLSGTHWLAASDPPNREQLKILSETIKTMLGLKNIPAQESTIAVEEQVKYPFLRDRKKLGLIATTVFAVAITAAGFFFINGSIINLVRTVQELISAF